MFIAESRERRQANDGGFGETWQQNSIIICVVSTDMRGERERHCPSDWPILDVSGRLLSPIYESVTVGGLRGDDVPSIPSFFCFFVWYETSSG